jgi:hypothetical protein
VPRYHWKGATAQGFKIEGDLEASSEPAALAQLRGQRITVSAIVETAAGGPIDTRPRERARKARGFTRFKSLSIAAMFAAAAMAVGYMAPLTVWSCERAGGTVACSIVERHLGVIERRRQQLSDVQSIGLETKVVNTNDSFIRTRLQKRIVFQDAKGGSIRSSRWDESRPREWFLRPPMASNDVMFEEFERFLGDDTAARLSTWGAFFVPLILVGVLLLLSLLTLSITAASMFIPREWVGAAFVASAVLLG